jgi:hypothetical protein
MTEINRHKLDLEASPVKGQLGSAVLDLNGRLIQCGGKLTDHNAIILYKMLLEVGMLKDETVERVTVGFASAVYAVARDDTHVYVVKIKAS